MHYVNEEALVDIYIDAGRFLGPYKKTDFDVIHHSRRAIFRYVMPGTVTIWYDKLDEVDGMTFAIDQCDREMDRAIPKDLLKRCHGMFLRKPDRFVRVGEPKELEFTLEREGKVHKLRRLDLRRVVVSSSVVLLLQIGYGTRSGLAGVR
jgi:hypothetical protein